ncbi:MAG TPA: histidinol-phosphate transaminase [Niastella sp.]
MATTSMRRSFLKKSVLLTGGLLSFPAIFKNIQAAPATPDKITGLHLYHPDEVAFETTPPDIVARLLANENPFGPSDKAKKAILESLELAYQYPMKTGKILEQKITEFEGVGSNQILLGAGSSPLLVAAALYFGKGTIVSAVPTYDAMLGQAERLGTKVIKVPLTPDYKFDLDAMEKVVDSNTSLVYICNPNNPTATVTDNAKLKAFCERVSKKTTVFIDEAYIDYLDNPQEASLIGSIKKGQNIIVARTFSKLYGFAGLRVGYLIALPEMINKLALHTGGPWSISSPALNAAIAAYQDKEFLQSAYRKTMESKKFLYDTLKTEGYEYIPSAANFVMFPLKMEGPRFAEEMMKRGVGIRSWKFFGKDWCRVSIGKMEEMQAFAKAFKELS